MSRQFAVISLSARSTNRLIIVSTILKHLIRWCSFYLTKLKFLIIKIIAFKWLIRVSSETSWCSTVTNFFRFRLSSSRAFCSSNSFVFVFRPRFLFWFELLIILLTSSWSRILLQSFCSRLLLMALVNMPKLRYSSFEDFSEVASYAST